jgi:hypothetical protein
LSEESSSSLAASVEEAAREERLRDWDEEVAAGELVAVVGVADAAALPPSANPGGEER